MKRVCMCCGMASNDAPRVKWIETETLAIQPTGLVHEVTFAVHVDTATLAEMMRRLSGGRA